MANEVPDKVMVTIERLITLKQRVVSTHSETVELKDGDKVVLVTDINKNEDEIKSIEHQGIEHKENVYWDEQGRGWVSRYTEWNYTPAGQQKPKKETTSKPKPNRKANKKQTTKQEPSTYSGSTGELQPRRKDKRNAKND